MSAYRDSPSLESQSYTDDPEFQQYAQELSDKLFTLTTNNTRLSKLIEVLGTRREKQQVRDRVKDLVDETSRGLKEVGEGLKKVSTWEDVGGNQKFTQNKLNREFKASLSEFQVLQRKALERQKASATAERAALEDQRSPTSPGQEGQQQIQQQEQEQLRLAPQGEVDFQEQLIIEREEEIRNIEQSVGELNELFRDVAHMVNVQGEQLDIIGENVEHVRDDTRGADIELRTASRHQKASRNKACCLLIILAVVLTIVILASVTG